MDAEAGGEKLLGVWDTDGVVLMLVCYWKRAAAAAKTTNRNPAFPSFGPAGPLDKQGLQASSDQISHHITHQAARKSKAWLTPKLILCGDRIVTGRSVIG